jgi:hypothetical protein
VRAGALCALLAEDAELASVIVHRGGRVSDHPRPALPVPSSLSQLHKGTSQLATPTCSGESCACHSALDLLTLNCSDILGVVEKREKGKTAAAV